MTKGKSVVVAFVAVMCAGACLARPCGPGRHGGWHRPPPIHHDWHGGYHHHGGYWGGAAVAISGRVSSAESLVAW